MSRARNTEPLVIGGEPRVYLLPPEVLRTRKDKATVRALGFGVIAAVLIVIAAVAGSFVLSVGAQIQLAAANDRTAAILAEQTQYSEVTTVQTHVELVKAAQQVGASTEIDWKDYLGQVQATLPASVLIDTVSVDTASPVALYEQPTALLQGPRIATVAFSATSSVLPDVPTWLRGLATLPGFADALPGSVQLDEATGVYTVNITMHVNDAAFSKRFAPEEEPPAKAPDEPQNSAAVVGGKE